MIDIEGGEQLNPDVDVFASEQAIQKVCRDFPRGFVEQDRSRALKVNDNAPNNHRDAAKLTECACGSHHKILHGSLRFCENFLKLESYDERQIYIRARRVCF